jgi:hypothetical protein
LNGDQRHGEQTGSQKTSTDCLTMKESSSRCHGARIKWGRFVTTKNRYPGTEIVEAGQDYDCRERGLFRAVLEIV